MYRRILIASDGSRHSICAARAAAALARTYGSCVTIVTVFDPSLVHAPFFGIPGTAIETAIDDGRYMEEVQSSIERTTGRVFEESGVEYAVRRELGHPADRIAAAACDEHADLVVVGRRGLSTILSSRLGSVSEAVMHRVRCSVLVAQE